MLIVLCIFRTSRILTYSELEAYSKPWYVTNPGKFRTLAYSKPEAYPEHCQTSAMRRFVKVISGYNYFCNLFLQNKLAAFFTSWNKYQKVVTPDVVILFRKNMARKGAEEREFLIYLLIYSNKFLHLQLITILVRGRSPPKSHEQDYLNFEQKS